MCVILGVCLAAAAAVGCGAAAQTDKPDKPDKSDKPKVVEIKIDNFSFSPAETTVAPGTEVKWVNHDDVPHTATSTARPKAFDSGTLDTDGTYSHVFDKPGTYEYFCAVHPKMTGKIIVK
jgi:plastocyanin